MPEGFYRASSKCARMDSRLKRAGMTSVSPNVYLNIYIKNLLALSFFIGGYFYEIESELVNNQTVALIAQLGGGKGKVTRHYFFKGLEKMLILADVTHFRKNHEIDDETWQEMLEFAT